MDEAVSVRHDEAAHQFCITLEGAEASVLYRRQGSVLDLYHTYVPEAVRGRGFAARLCRAAVEFALEGKNAVMPTIVRTSDDPYEWEVGSAGLAAVANVEKKLPGEYIADDGFGVTEACLRYLRPLIEGEAYPPYKNGLPDYVTIKAAGVAKKLG